MGQSARSVPLPAPASKQITAERHSVLGNAFWLGLDRVIRMPVGFVVSVLVIRHLGPAGNGLLQSGLALAAILTCVVELGLEGVVRRDLVRTPDRPEVLLGVATFLRLGALLPLLAVFLALHTWQTGGSQLALGGWLAVTLALPVGQIFDTWLLAHDRMRASAIASISALGASTLLRIGLVIAGASVVAFGAAAAAETLLVIAGVWLAFRLSQGSPRALRFEAPEAGRLLRASAPLLFTNLAVLVYRRCDVLIVTSLLHAHAAGIYAAAVRLAETGYILPMIVLNAWFPRLTRLHREDPRQFRIEMARFYRLLTWLGLAFAGAATLAAPILVPLLFGPAYTETTVPFTIYAWTAVFIAQGIARSQWLLLENRLVEGLGLAVAGAGLNLLLNFLLVPVYGPAGAAWAAVLALAANVLGFTAWSARTRPAWHFGWRALLLPFGSAANRIEPPSPPLP